MTSDSYSIKPADPKDAVADDCTFASLLCLHCGYNLTGSPDGRCPECGTPFDRGMQQAWLAGAPAPIPIWSNRAWAGFIISTVRTLAAVIFTPVGWACRLPEQLDRREVRRFQRTCYALAVVIAFVPAVFRAGMWWPTVLMIGAWGVGALVCESLVTNVVFDSDAVTCLGADCRPPRRRGVGETLCAYVVVTALIFALGEILAVVLPSFAFLDESRTVGLAAAALWWWLSIVRSSRAIGYPALDVLAVTVVVPVLVVLAGVVAWLCSMVTTFLVMTIVAGFGGSL